MRTDPVLFDIKLLRVLMASVLTVSHKARLPTSVFPLLTIVYARARMSITVGWELKILYG